MLSARKLLILTVFTWFLILEKIQDGDYVQVTSQTANNATTHKMYIILFSEENQRLSTEGKIISKYCNTSKTKRGVHQPLFLYHGGAMTLRVRPRVNKSSKKGIKWTRIENLIVKDFLRVRQVISQDERLLTTVSLEKGSQTSLGYWFSTSNK